MIVVAPSYSFPATDNTTARYQDLGMGAADRVRSWAGWSADIMPLAPSGTHVLRQDNATPLYGAWGNTLDDWAVVTE